MSNLEFGLNFQHRLRSLSLQFIVLWMTATGICHAAEMNEWCPVQPDVPATASYSTEYKGVVVQFCCNECLTEFLADPDRYVAKVPQLVNRPLWPRIVRAVEKNWDEVLIVTLLVSLITVRVKRIRRKKKLGEQATQDQSIWDRDIQPHIPVGIMVAMIVVESVWVHNRLHDQFLINDIHYATFTDFGYPPVPPKPKESPRLSTSWYRGNDERSDKLFNGGNYRTASFHLSMRSENSPPLEHGDVVQDQPLHILFEIERPPHTPDFLYEPRLMERMFLTREVNVFLGRNGPEKDRIPLEIIEPMQRWEAKIPILSPPIGENSKQSGIVYICEEFYYKSQLHLGRFRGGSRYHYAIQYDLEFQDGKILPSSHIWMGALYRTRKFPQWEVPYTEWFSANPIPEIPSEQKLNAKLLGTDDYFNPDGPR